MTLRFSMPRTFDSSLFGALAESVSALPMVDPTSHPFDARWTAIEFEQLDAFGGALVAAAEKASINPKDPEAALLAFVALYHIAQSIWISRSTVNGQDGTALTDGEDQPARSSEDRDSGSMPPLRRDAFIDEGVRTRIAVLGPTIPVDAVAEGASGGPPIDPGQLQGMLTETHFGKSGDIGDPSHAAMGIVDTSIAFLNQRFRRRVDADPTVPDKTRFEMLWLQDRSMGEHAPPYAKFFNVGTLLLARDINNLIDRHWDENTGELDEASAYAEFVLDQNLARTRFRDSWKLRMGHGTSVLDAMAGFDATCDRQDRAIYGVELPTRLIVDTSGQQMLAFLPAAIAAINGWSFIVPLLRAKKFTETPLIVNASLAFTGGYDQGKTALATEVQRQADLLHLGGLRQAKLTIPAGNFLQSRTHARMPGNAAGEITWLVPPDDRTSSILQMFQNQSGNDIVGDPALMITVPGFPPAHLPIPCVDHFIEIYGNGLLPIARFEHKGNTSELGGPALVLNIYPTEHPDPYQPVAPAGLWKISCENAPGPEWLFWILRDETLPGMRPNGRQSHFWDTTYFNFDDTVGDLATDVARDGERTKRGGTASTLYSAGNAVTGVDGLQVNRGQAGYSMYRANGYERLRNEPGANTKLAEWGRAKGGLLTTGRQNRSAGRISGTSIASAFLARVAADELTGVSTCDPQIFREEEEY